MKKPSLFEIFKIYFLIGIQLIGGGYVILPLLKKYLVEERNWMKEEELIDYLALSQCLPGIIALNISIFSGYELRKIKGAIDSVLGLLLPSFVIIILVANFVFNVADNKYVQDAFFGIRLSIIVLIFFMVYDIFKKSVRTNFSVF
ncbi:MAG: chromate transporter, partial [bacterium]|nr:chromate transporter [bacterium]